MKKNKKINISNINILSVIDIIFLSIFIYLLFRINILPSKYFLLITIIIFIINILSILFINLKNKILKIIGVIIMILAILFSITGSYYLYTGNKFLNDSFNNIKNETSTYYIITNKTSKYNKKSDITGTINYYKNSPNINKALKQLKNDFSIKTNTYEDVTAMFNDIVNNNIDFILIDSASYNIVFDLNKNINKSDFKIVHKFDIKEEIIQTDSQIKDKFNIYIGGTDFAGLMDYNSIITINTKTHEILMTSIPRDYYMDIYGMDGKKDTLSHMNAYGPDVNMKSLEKFFDIKIDYSIKINTESLVGLVDKIGGITYCSDQSFTTTHALVLNTYDDRGKQKLHIKKGCQELNGIQTLTVARERNSFIGRDRMRQKNCQKIIIGIFDKLKSTNSFINFNSILNSLSNLYTTDIPREVVTNMAKKTVDGADWKFITQSVDGGDGTEFITIINEMGYAMIPNTNDVINARNKIYEVLK